MTDILFSNEYITFLNTIKHDIRSARVRASLSVNKELILLYWRIGNGILHQQKEKGWGSKVIDQLSLDLKHSFPDMKGFSKQNLSYMRQFASEYDENAIVQQPIGEIPWGHNIDIFTKLKDPKIRLWYIQKTIEFGWSRNILVMQIESKTHLRRGHAQTNFKKNLSETTSDLAHEIVKSSYNFEFLGLMDDVHERIIEKKLINHIRDFLLELGAGFAYLGSQYKINVGDEDFFIDLLFYHVRLRCYIVIELKSGKFMPEFAGKLGFYVTAINKQMKHESDNPTIGLLLCKQNNKLIVEYALNNQKQPISVSEYTTLPKEYENLLPSPEQLQHLVNTMDIKENDTPMTEMN